jgi:protein-S-isoprenylcysteine O-methyltransferase Ste14
MKRPLVLPRTLARSDPNSVTHAESLLLTSTWLAYFAIHSLLASHWLKRRIAAARPGWMPLYRFAFNLAAIGLLIPPLGLLWTFRGEPLWEWTGLAAWVANGLALAAAAGFVWSLRFYDSREFLGLRQWLEGVRSVEDQEVFRISPLHRFVRHPWYSLGLVILWTRPMDAALLLTSCLVTGYFAVGSKLEDRKLIACHGRPYEDYRRQVPGLIPRPWRYLQREEARTLERRAREGD